MFKKNYGTILQNIAEKEWNAISKIFASLIMICLCAKMTKSAEIANVFLGILNKPI
jgi:hypothetical protein